MGIRITPGTTPQARAELSAYIMAYPVTPAAPGIYWTPTPQRRKAGRSANNGNQD